MNRILGALSPQSREAAEKDPMQFLSQYSHFQTILVEAEKNKLADQSPYRERIADMRRQILVNAQLNEFATKYVVTPEMQKKQYDQNPDSYKEVKAKIIYIPFTVSAAPASTGGKRVLTEPEAKTRAEEVVKKARVAGADFGKLVEEYSEDPTSKAKGGDLGIPIRANNQNVPEPMRKVVLTLKAGDVSEPYRHDNGFYIFRAETAGVLPYDQVKDDIFKELKDVALKNWLEETKKQSTFKIESENYFSKYTKQ
jgi:parvulin-like peptidyl-prolyl isomerase